VLDILSSLNAGGTTIILITHDIAVVLQEQKE
jgi:ABC-type dipeptide/oligopeptide/nickel transport system ATPase component